MKPKRPELTKFLTIYIGPALMGMAPHSAHAASATWNGGAATNVLNTAANWTAGGPPVASGDIATWDGTASGDLALTWTGAFGAGFGAVGTSINVTAAQSSSLSIGSSSATTSTNADQINIGNITIASGAGAFTLGDGTGFDDMILRSLDATPVNFLTNNSSNTATLAANVYFNSGGGLGRTLTFDGTGNWQVNSGLRFSNNSAMTVVKNGAGTLTLTGGAITGGTTAHTINAGTLRVAGSGLLGATATLPGNIINNAAFSYESSASQTISGIVSGLGALHQSGGNLILTGTNTYSGSTTINGGTLNIGGTGSIDFSSGITVDGASAKYLHTSTTPSIHNIALTQGTVAGTGTISAVTVGNGTGGMIANGNGNSASLGLGNLTFNGAASIAVTDDGDNFTSGITVSGALSTTPANGLVTIDASSSFWNSGVIYELVSAGSFGGSITDFTKGTITGLTSRQSSSLVLNGSTIGLLIGGDSPRWSGLDSSNWVVGSTGANGNWRLITGGTKTDYIQGDVVLFNDAATNTTVTISTADVSPAVINFNNSSKNYIINGAFGIAAGATVNKNGSGTVTISSANTYSGGTTINAGTITLSGAGTLGASSGAVTIADGTVNLGGTSQTVGSLAITGEALIQNGTLTASGLTASNPVGFATISSGLNLGSGNLSKSGDGTLTLIGSTAYSGATTISGGVLALGGSGSLGSTSGVTLSGGTLDLGGTTQSTNPITISAAGFGEAIMNGTIEPSALNLTATSGVAVVSANITGSTGVTLSPAAPGGTLSLTGANTFTGPLNLAGPATVSIDGGSNDGGGLITYNSFGTAFTISSGSYYSGGITTNGLSEFRTLNLNGGVLESLGDVFANTLAISINFNGGTLRSGHPDGITVFDYNNLIQINGGGATFDTTTGGITVGNNADMIGTGNVHIPTVNLPKLNGTGGGTITLMGGNSLVSGITNNGLLEIQGNSTWNLNGIASSLGGLSGDGSVTNSAGAAVLTLNVDSGPFTYSGTIAGGAGLSLVKQGTGTQTLSGSNTYQGDTTVAAGTLVVSSNSATTFGNGSVISIASGAVLDLPNAAVADVVAGLIIDGTPLPPGTYDASTPETSAYITGSGQLQVVVGFANWMTQFTSLDAAQRLPDADPDSDGIANLVEYAVAGLSPVTPDASPGTFAGLTLSFPKRAEAVANGDVTYGVEESSDLGPTDPWALVVLPNPHVTDTSALISYSFNTSTDGAKDFVRLKVAQN